MNRIVFLLATYVLLAVQSGLAPLWSFGSGGPNLLLVLAAFVGTSAARTTVLFALLFLGLLLDLQPGPTRLSGVILGPHAVGLLIGGYAVLQLRSLMFRESTITIVIMTLVLGGMTGFVETLIYSVRGLPWLAGDPLPHGALSQLGHELRQVGYTALVAIPLGLMLQATRRLWSFTPTSKHERIF